MGFEPTTFGLEVRRAFPLRHRDSTLRLLYIVQLKVIIIYKGISCS